MPYVSDAEERYFNAQRGKKIPAATVDEFNAASKGLSLPARIRDGIAKKRRA